MKTYYVRPDQGFIKISHLQDFLAIEIPDDAVPPQPKQTALTIDVPARIRQGGYAPGERHRAWPEWTWNGRAFRRTKNAAPPEGETALSTR